LLIYKGFKKTSRWLGIEWDSEPLNCTTSLPFNLQKKETDCSFVNIFDIKTSWKGAPVEVVDLTAARAPGVEPTS